MANKSVLELAVGTGQWDAGLKKAKQALDNFTSAQGGLQQALEKDNGDMTAFIKMMSNMDSTAKTTKQQLREISNVLTDFTATYRTLTDEQKNSPFGQELANGIQTLTERAGVLRDAMDDVQLSIKGAASDTRLFDQMAQGMSVATAGFQGLTGAGKLLGIEMGNDVEVIAKLQAAMAVTNSLTTIQNALQKESALMQGLNAIKTKANAAAHALLSGELTAAAIAQKTLNLAIKAAPYAIAATVIGAAVSALGIFSSSTDDAASAQDRLNQTLDKTLSKLKDITSEYELQAYKKSLLGGEGDEEKLRNDFLKGMDRSIALQKERDKLLSADAIGNKYYTPTQLNYKGRVFTKEGGIYDQQYGKDWRTKGITVVSDENKKAAAELDKKIAEERDQWVSAYSKYIAYGEVTQQFETSWQQLTDPKEIKAAISYFTKVADSLDIDESYNQKYDEYMQRVSKLQAMLRKPLKTTTGGGGGGGGTTTTTEKEITETQELQKNIAALTKEYQQLSDAEKVADFNASTAIDLRKSAIRGEIQANQQRIDELKKFADEAKQLLPKNQEAVFKLTVDKEKLDSLKTAISGLSDKSIKVDVEKGRVELPSVPADDETIKVNVEQGNIDLPNVPTDDETIKVNMEQGDVNLPKIPEQYTMTIIADTSEAMVQVQNLVDDVSSKTITLRAKVEMETGISGSSEGSISEYVKKLQDELANIDYSVVGSFQKAISLNSNITDAATLGNLLKTSIQEGIDLAAAGIDVEGIFSDISANVNIDDGFWKDIEDKINAYIEENGLEIEPITIDIKTGGIKPVTEDAKKASDTFRQAAAAVGSIGSALESLEDPGAKVAGIIANAIATIAQTFAASLKGTVTPWDWIAGAAAGTATMISTISAIKSATKTENHAVGGFIGGNSYSGDNILMPINGGYAGLSSGELVLNRAQQGALASQLQDTGHSGYVGTPYTTGETIVLGVNNHFKRSGQGEIVTTGMLKRMGVISTL